MKDLKFYKLFYLFIFGSIFGWVIEVIPNIVIDGVFYNHSSLVIGPFNLVYGIGAVIITLLLYSFKDSSSLLIFIASSIFGTIFEYLMSLCMELLVGFTAWDYSHLPLNINGRVSIRFTIFWGLLGIVWFKHLYPYMMENVINKFKEKKATKIMYIIIPLLILDGILTLSAVDRAKKKDEGIKAQNKYEEFLDNTFNKEYLTNMFNNSNWDQKK